MYYTSRISASDGRGNSFYVFGEPLPNQYKYSIKDTPGVSKPECCIPNNLDGATDETIQKWASDCEGFVPQTPQEEDMVKKVHAALCSRLNWVPKVLSH